MDGRQKDLFVIVPIINGEIQAPARLTRPPKNPGIFTFLLAFPVPAHSLPQRSSSFRISFACKLRVVDPGFVKNRPFHNLQAPKSRIPACVCKDRKGEWNVIRHILVPLDGSVLAEGALPQAIAVAKAFSADITLLRIVETGVEAGFEGRRPVDAVEWRSRQAEARAYLIEIKQRLRSTNLEVGTIVAEGSASQEILRCSRQQNADLIILTSHGHQGADEFDFGPTLHQVISAASVSIMLVRPADERITSPEASPYRRILVPLDGSRRAEWALCLASTVASFHNATLLLAHVVQVPEMARAFSLGPEEEQVARRLVELNRAAAESYLAQQKSQLSLGDNCEYYLEISRRVPRAIQELAEKQQVDLVVLSAHGYSGDRQWLYGGVAGSLISHCRIPLLVLQDVAFDLNDHEDAERRLVHNREAG